MRRQLSPAALLIILTGLNLLNYLDRFVLNAVRTPLANDFGVSYGESGRAFTAFMLGYFITSPFFGYLGDRFSRKWLIAFGIFIWSLGTLLTGFAGTFATLLCFRVLVGVGEASYATISPGLISDVFISSKRNNALTIFYVAIPVGAALGYVLGGEISTHWGWRQAFIWAGIPGLLLAVVLLPFAEPKRGQSDLQAAVVLEKPKLADFLGLFRNAKYQLLIWGYVAYTFAMGAFSFLGADLFRKSPQAFHRRRGQVFRRGAGRGGVGRNARRRFPRDGVAKKKPGRLCKIVVCLRFDFRAPLPPRFSFNKPHRRNGLSGRRNFPFVSFNGADQHADTGTGSGELADERDGAFDLYDSFIRRYVVPGNRWAHR